MAEAGAAAALHLQVVICSVHWLIAPCLVCTPAACPLQDFENIKEGGWRLGAQGQGGHGWRHAADRQGLPRRQHTANANTPCSLRRRQVRDALGHDHPRPPPVQPAVHPAARHRLPARGRRHAAPQVGRALSWWGRIGSALSAALRSCSGCVGRLQAPSRPPLPHNNAHTRLHLGAGMRARTTPSGSSRA